MSDESKEPEDSQAKENVDIKLNPDGTGNTVPNVMDKQTKRGWAFESKPLRADHPIFTAGFLFARPLHPASSKKIPATPSEEKKPKDP